MVIKLSVYFQQTLWCLVFPPPRHQILCLMAKQRYSAGRGCVWAAVQFCWGLYRRVLLQGCIVTLTNLKTKCFTCCVIKHSLFFILFYFLTETRRFIQHHIFCSELKTDLKMIKTKKKKKSIHSILMFESLDIVTTIGTCLLPPVTVLWDISTAVPKVKT